MNNSIAIKVFEVVGSKLCVASSDGQKVHDQIAAALKAGKHVSLSFSNVESLTSAFLNAAIGQLYGDFSEQKIRGSVSVSEMSADDVELVKRVVEAAKQYFKNPAQVKKIVGENLGG
jgi:translation initiation factor 2 alpha subunit (eIF-2alpha)